jgi:hypothetical protein
VRRRLLLVLLVVLGAGLLPGRAHAGTCSKPDLAAIDQYCELLPGADGAVPPGFSDRTLRDVLPMMTRRLLNVAGPPGQAILALPVGAPMRRGGGRDSLAPGARDALKGEFAVRDGDAAGVAGAVSRLIEGGGLSELFRWAVLLSTLALVGVAWVRRRRHTERWLA